MFRWFDKNTLSFIAVLLLLLSNPLYGQDSTNAGIYNLGGRTYEMILNIDGKFEFSHPTLNRGKTFHGTWTRVNDSTIKAHSDTVVTSGLDRDRVLNDFYCVQSRDTGIIRCYFRYISTVKKDTVKFVIWLLKEASFHTTGELKQQDQWLGSGRIITTFYPNGHVKEVIEYNKEHVKHGLYLKYGLDGRMTVYQKWRKGKLKKEIKWEKRNWENGNIND